MNRRSPVLPESVVVRHAVQLVLDLFDPALDVAAQPVNGFLVAVFALLVFLQHSEKQVDVQSRPNALTDAQLEDFADAFFCEKALHSYGFRPLNHGNHPLSSLCPILTTAMTLVS